MEIVITCWGSFFCFPTGRWEVSGKLAKKVWAYIENLHVYLLFQICNGKKIVNIYWNHYFLKERKKSFVAKTLLNEELSTSFQPPLDRNLWLFAMIWGTAMGKKTVLREKWCTGIGHNAMQWAQNHRKKSKEPIQMWWDQWPEGNSAANKGWSLFLSFVMSSLSLFSLPHSLTLCCFTALFSDLFTLFFPCP